MQPTAASTFPEELQTRLQYFDDGDVTLHDALADILRDDEDTDNNPSGYWRARKAVTCIARVSILFYFVMIWPYKDVVFCQPCFLTHGERSRIILVICF